MTKDEEDKPWEEQAMVAADATQYRAMTARLNVLPIDRPGLQYACKGASIRMARPVNQDWVALTRIASYVLGKPRVVHYCKWHTLPSAIRIYVDSNWAGCTKTRQNSATGVCVVHGYRLIRPFAKTQANIALSSAEAELYAHVSTASGGSGA